MTHFVAIQSTYTAYQIGIYSIKTGMPIDIIEHDKRTASRDLIPELDIILKKHHLTITDIPFIAVNQGPGPFTSQRVIITTVNGIAFTHQTVLVGIDSLQALLKEHVDQSFDTTVALLNAYNKDLYYAIEYKGSIIKEGCKNYQLLFDDLKNGLAEPARFLGNGVELFKEEIKKEFSSLAVIPEPKIEEASLDEIAKLGLSKYHNKETSEQLAPIYLKELSYKPAM